MLNPQTKPSLSTSRVWSATDMHEFVPVDATWAAGVVTFTYKNHGLATGDVAKIGCVDTTSPWHMGDKTVTVPAGSKDTFQVNLVGDPGYFPNAKPYAQDNLMKRVIVMVPKYSRTFYLQDYVQIDLTGSTVTGMKLQMKLNDDAAWVDASAPFASITASGIMKFTDKYNFMRLTMTAGATTTLPTVYTQKNVY